MVFSCSLCQECACRTSTRPCRSGGRPCGAGWSPSRPALWWTSPARPSSVSQWNRTSVRNKKSEFGIGLVCYRDCVRISSSRLTWGSLCWEDSLCSSRREWLTLFSRVRAHSRASKPLPHSSFSGFCQTQTQKLILTLLPCLFTSKMTFCL